MDDLYESRASFSSKFKAFCIEQRDNGHANRFILGFLVFNELRQVKGEIDHKLVDEAIRLLREKHDIMREAY